jgi:uncharacterized protein (DUF4415 family)
MDTRRPVATDDDDNPEWTADDFARARPASSILPPAAAVALVRQRGRPPLADVDRKQSVTLRLSPEVLTALRAGGRGWQTRVDAMLREAMGLGRS